MKTPRTRRDFLADIGRGMMIASLGSETASGLGLAPAVEADEPHALVFGRLEPLVLLMQETAADHLLPKLQDKLRSGTSLRDLVSAAALANARTFGGEDYIGFHTAMALSPAWHMSQELSGDAQALPVFKVLYRNTSRILDQGGRRKEVLHPVAPARLPANQNSGELLRDNVRRKDMNAAEQTFAAIAAGSPDDAFNALLYAVHDHDEVHRVVLPYRAWDMLGLIGKEHAHTMLRQSVRYCVNAESRSYKSAFSEPRDVLPKVFEQHKLDSLAAGVRKADDAWLDRFSRTLFESSPDDAAHAVGAALAEGFSIADIGEAITLAANQLLLRDIGRTPEMEIVGKPIGSVHGDSIGVHACDSANAWRNMSRVTNPRNSIASLILGAHQVAKDRVERGGDFLHWKPVPVEWHLKGVKTTDPSRLLNEADESIRGNLQARTAAIIHRYGELGHDPRGVFDLMLKYAISEDGALHAEKFYRTATEEFNSTRPAFRWRHLLALARVTASEYGRPAPGVAQARELLKLS